MIEETQVKTFYVETTLTAGLDIAVFTVKDEDHAQITINKCISSAAVEALLGLSAAAVYMYLSKGRGYDRDWTEENVPHCLLKWNK